MKKRILALLLILCMLVGAVACKQSTPPDDEQNNNSQNGNEENKGDEKPAQTSIFSGEEKVIDIYLIAGQSNAVGYTDIVKRADAYEFAPGIKNGYKNVIFAGELRWDSGDSYASKEYSWVRTKLGYGAGDSGEKMGPEVGMAAALSEYYNSESGKVVGLIKYGHGGTSLLTRVTDSTGPSNKFGTWVPPTYAQTVYGMDTWSYEQGKTGLLYRELLRVTKEKLQALANLGYTNVNIKGLYWMQGENDRFKPDEYKKAFTYFASDIRRDLAEIVKELTGGDDRGASTMPIFVGTISQTQNLDSASAEETNKEFIKMQNNLPKLVENCHIIDNSQFKISAYVPGKPYAVSEGLGSDAWHWNQADHLQIGYNVGQKMLEVSGLK